MGKVRWGAALRWGLTVAILGYSGWRLAAAWTSLEPTDLAFRPLPAALSALAGAAALVTLGLLSAAGLRAAGLPEGPPPPRLWPMWTRVWLQSYFYRYVPGKVMLVVERVRLGERLGVPRATSVVLVVWESLLLMAGAGLLAGLGLLVRPPRAEDPISGAAVGGLALAALLGSLALWPVLRVMASRFSAVRTRVPGLVLAVPARAQIALAAGYAGAWLLLGVSFAALCHALSPAAELDPVLLVSWFVASYVGGQVSSVTPAGLGVREGLLVAGLAGTVAAPVALAWAVAHRILLSLVELVVVSASLLVELPEE